VFITGNMSETLNMKSSSSDSRVAIIYTVFAIIGLLVYYWIAQGEFSSVLTVSAIVQCMAFALLAMQALANGSVRGISAKSLQLDALALVCRLSSTTWLNGYLPEDVTGDWLYQCFDFLSLGMVLWLLHRVLVVQRDTYDASVDTLSPTPWAVGCLILAFIFHGDLNDRPIFDALWMCGLNVSAIAVLPQLWVMTHINEATSVLTSHFVAVMALARILSGSYMFYAHAEITCDPWFGDFEHAGYAILAAHAVHLILLGDFGYLYVKNLATRGLNAPLALNECWQV